MNIEPPRTEVNVSLRFFAKAREIVGYSSINLQLPSKIDSYESLLNLIVNKYNLEEIRHNLILAINGEYCNSFGDSANSIIELKNGDEIAVIPPLSGG